MTIDKFPQKITFFKNDICHQTNVIQGLRSAGPFLLQKFRPQNSQEKCGNLL